MRVRVQGMPTPSHFPPLAQIQNCWWAWDLWQSCHCWNSQPYLTPVHSSPPLPYQLTLHSIDRSSRWLEMPAVNQLSSLAGQTTNNKHSCRFCLSISIISANIHGSVCTCVSISSFLRFPSSFSFPHFMFVLLGQPFWDWGALCSRITSNTEVIANHVTFSIQIDSATLHNGTVEWKSSFPGQDVIWLPHTVRCCHLIPSNTYNTFKSVTVGSKKCDSSISVLQCIISLPWK